MNFGWLSFHLWVSLQPVFVSLFMMYDMHSLFANSYITILLTSRMNFIFAVLVGALNDRLLLANPTEISPKQKKGVEIKSCLVGLLEPLLIGFATMQQNFEQKLDLSEILYQITSRWSSFCLYRFVFFVTCKTSFYLHFTSGCCIRYRILVFFFSFLLY